MGKKRRILPGRCVLNEVSSGFANLLPITGYSGVIDHLIPGQTDHPKLIPKSKYFTGHFYGYKVG
jgi:hypothetical protein